MINANELRIGNWINVKCIAESIKGCDEFDPQPCNINNMIGIKNNESDFEYEPIPLTPEILEKCGFEIEGSEAGDDGAMQLGNMHEQKGITFLYVPKVGNYTEKDTLGLWIGRDFGMQQIQIDLEKVKHLHQLQNLYFALTGQELEINL